MSMPPWVNPMIPEDEELAQSLLAYDEEIDSYQAGTVGGKATQMGPQQGPMPPRGQQGPPAPTAQMPQAYTQNRMQQWGMPKVAQWGEGMVDKYRANKWQGQQDELANALDPQKSQHPAGKAAPIEVDEVQMLMAGGDAQTAYDNATPGGTGAASIGNAVGKLGKMYFGAM